MPPTIPVSAITSLALTNPLILYRSLLVTKKLQPSPTQYRLAFELEKIYHRLKDYNPNQKYGHRIKAIRRAIRNVPDLEGGEAIAVRGHPLRRNPLFAHLFTKSQERETLALTRVLTSHEEAMKLDSPRGFLLHGEVGTGKSMFLDLLANSLPNRNKGRWHFNTFMLETMAQLESFRVAGLVNNLSNDEPEHSLLWLAKDLIEKSPILFLDEFQLPDRATSKILSNLFTTFFQLGGVLIASSNRMPDELVKASGVDYAVQSRGGLVRKLFGFGGQSSLGMFPGHNEYAAFVDVLKARCDIYDLSGQDWRRREAREIDSKAEAAAELMREEMIDGSGDLDSMTLVKERQHSATTVPQFKFRDATDRLEETNLDCAKTPRKYVLIGCDETKWQQLVQESLPLGTPVPIPWQSTTLVVYGRKFFVPCHIDGVAFWSFVDLCGGNYGPADYITVASTFHTIILDSVPILTLLQKNEARRLITLLDALYEARCKLIVRAEAGPDELFFSETNAPSALSPNGPGSKKIDENGDAVYPETLSEIYQDQTSPFRPNVSTYTDNIRSSSGYDPDEDSDFGPVPGKGNEIGRQVDFGMTSSFTGEDEKFAYKRARSRLWELCSATWNARSEPGWWTPLPTEVRRWERSSSTTSPPTTPQSAADAAPRGDVKLGPSVELDEPAGLQVLELKNKKEERRNLDIPAQENLDSTPKRSWTAWGVLKWGTKA